MRQVRVKGHVSIKLGPLCPVRIVRGGLTIRKYLWNVVCRSAEAIAETSFLGGVHNLHGSVCGCEASMWERKPASVRSCEWDGRLEVTLSTQSCGNVCSVGTIGGWPVGVGGGLAATFMFLTLPSSTRDPPCCLFGKEWSARVCRSSRPYMCDGSRCPPYLGHCWWPGLLSYPMRPVGLWYLWVNASAIQWGTILQALGMWLSTGMLLGGTRQYSGWLPTHIPRGVIIAV